MVRKDLIKIFELNIKLGRRSFCDDINCGEQKCPLHKRCNQIPGYVAGETYVKLRNEIIKEYINIHRNMEQW